MTDDTAQAGSDFRSLVTSRLYRRPALLGMVLTLVLLTTLLLVLARDHRQKIDGAERQAAAVALGTDRLLTLQMRNLERALKGVAFDFAKLSSGPHYHLSRAQEMVRGVAQRHAELMDVQLVRRDGSAVTAGAGDPRIAIWTARAENRASANGLVVGEPASTAGGTEWFIPLAVPLIGGNETGWVLARLRVSSLVDITAGQDVGRSGVVNVFHSNGAMLARSTGGARGMGEDYSRSELMRQLPRQAQGTTHLVSPIDGVRRIVSYRSLADYPLIAMVGLGRSEVLAPWNVFAAVSALVVLLYVLGWFLLVRTLLRSITDMSGAHVLLQETEAQYRLLFEQNPLPFWVFHRETFRILEANEAAVAQYGYSRAEFQQMSLLDIRPQEDAEEALRVARMGAPETRRGRVWRHLRKDGTVIAVAVHSSDITFRGEPARLVLALDVTERLEEQRRLEVSEARFQLVAQATSDAVFDWNIVTGESWRSASFASLFHYGPSDMPHTIDAWWDRVHPDDVQRVKDSLQRVFDSDETEWYSRYRFRRGDGSYAHVLDRGRLERDPDGKPLRMVGGMVDVSRQHQDEAELRLLRRAIESAENGIAISDALAPDMPLVYVNGAFQRITGYSEAESIGRNCRFLQADDHRQPQLEVVRAAIAAKQEAQVLLRNYRKDGERFYNQLSVAPVRGDDGAYGGPGTGQVTHFVGILNDVTERRRQEDQLAYQASHDELTGLFNRSSLLASLEHVLRRAGDSEVLLLHLDISNFKMINDSLGHDVGDEVLRVVADRLRAVAGAADRAARIGGNEFLVVLTTDEPGSSTQAQVDRVTEALTQPVEALDTLHYLSLNAGIARYPGHATTPDALIRNAGLATHVAKRRGPNQTMEYQPEFERKATDRQQMVSRLHEAIERKEFELFFQPLYSTRPMQPVGLEALIRWRHPERGLVPPSEFIPVCEDSGLIVPLGRWVLRDACRHHRLLADAGWPGLTIACNVSAMQFLSGELLHDIPALLREFALPPGVLELELTESLVMENPEPVIEVMRELRGHGVKLSIDDFGTGYSSMAYLHRLPVDKLKIDRSFVNEVENEGHNAAICESILALARRFDLRVIAEGVETQAQFEWLREHGCDEAQGYLLARPQPFPELLLSLGPGPGK